MGSRQSGTQTVTQTNEPPQFLQPFLQAGAQGAFNLFQQGGPEQFPGQTVVPFSPQTQEGLNLLTTRAREGSPVVGAAQGAILDILGGQDPTTNALFQRAARQTRSQLESEFAGAGRDLEARLPARTEQLNDLATTFFGQERGRQLQAAALAPTLAQQDFADISQLLNVGQITENQARALIQDRVGRFQFEQQRPESALDSFLQRIGLSTSLFGNTATQQTPLFTNPIGGGLGGAATGAALGSVIPGLGTGVGAGVGGLLGLLGAI